MFGSIAYWSTRPGAADGTRRNSQNLRALSPDIGHGSQPGGRAPAQWTRAFRATSEKDENLPAAHPVGFCHPAASHSLLVVGVSANLRASMDVRNLRHAHLLRHRHLSLVQPAFP